MATRFVGLPHSAEFPSSNFPQITQINARPVLALTPLTMTRAWMRHRAAGRARSRWSSYCMALATSGTVGLQAQIEFDHRRRRDLPRCDDLV